MAIKAKLKFKGDMPYWLENKLILKGGFAICSRHNREWIIVDKVKPPFKAEVLINGELPEDIRNDLTKRCNTIVNHFLDPDSHKIAIKLRLGNMANLLPQLQGQFVREWIKNNVDEDGDDDELIDYSGAV